MKYLKYGIRLVGGFLKYTLTKKPRHANYDVTWRCNLNCEHCYWKKYSGNKKELMDEEWGEVFKKHRREGLRYAMFTGGEPSLRQNIISIANGIFSFVE